MNLLGDIFNSPVFVPATQLDSAHAVAPATIARPGGASPGGTPAAPQATAPVLYAAAHRNAPAPGCASRAALGSAYVARWVWGRERTAGAAGSAPTTMSFEDEIRRLLARRWNATIGIAQRKPGAGVTGSSVSQSPAPYLQQQRSAAVGTSVLVEEEEEEEEVREGINNTNGSGTPSAGAGSGTPPRIRTTTGSSLASALTASLSISTSASGSPGGSSFTAFTSPDVGATGIASVNGATTPTDTQVGLSGAATSTGITPLTPVSALSTGDAEAQLGWTKVADPDYDSFMAYASIIPEFVRLESLLIKSLV